MRYNGMLKLGVIRSESRYTQESRLETSWDLNFLKLESSYMVIATVK